MRTIQTYPGWICNYSDWLRLSRPAQNCFVLYVRYPVEDDFRQPHTISHERLARSGSKFMAFTGFESIMVVPLSLGAL